MCSYMWKTRRGYFYCHNVQLHVWHDHHLLLQKPIIYSCCSANSKWGIQMKLGLFTLQKAPAVGESTDWKWRKGGEKRERWREWGGAINLCHSQFYNELQLWLQIKTELFSFFFLGDYLQSGAWMEVWSQQRKRKRALARREERDRSKGKWGIWEDKD